MTSFEAFLLNKGYVKHILNCKTMRYETAKAHTISTMVNLDHRYIHNADTKILNKIENCKSVMDEDFTWEDRKGVICFGLHEKDKPPTLISPRPKIKVKRFRTFSNEQIEVLENEQFDDSMNLVLSKIDFENIFKGMYDNSIVFEFDLTESV